MTALQTAAIEAHVRANILERLSIRVFDTLASTNGHALMYPPKLNQWQVTLAESQTAGRGRLGRTWHSPAHDNIYLSLSWLLDRGYAHRRRLPALSLVIGLGVIEVLRRLAPMVDWRLKWPNDVWGNGQKVAGILLESQSLDGQLQLVVGVGLNVHGRQWPGLDKPVTSLVLLMQQDCDRALIVASLLNQWTLDIPVFLTAGLESFQDRWRSADALLGCDVILTTPQGQVTGTAHGINATGALQLKHEDGQIHSHHVGEIQRLLLKP